MAFFKNLDKNDDSDIIEKFESANRRDDFYYAFKMFSKAMDAVLPKKEAHPYIKDLNYAPKIKQMLRAFYDGPETGLRDEGRKVQQLIDDYIRSLSVQELIEPRKVTNDNFLTFIIKFKSEKARTALIKNRARQIINEFAPNNPVYYERLRERLERIIKDEEKRRKENADYFNQYKALLEEALAEENRIKELGFANRFELAVYEKLFQLSSDDRMSKDLTHKISDGIQNEIGMVDWVNKRSSEKNISVIIYDLLETSKTKVKMTEDEISDLTSLIVDLAKRDLQNEPS